MKQNSHLKQQFQTIRHPHQSESISRRVWGWLALLALAALVTQLTGCASAPLDERTYNPVTGYPAVGDRLWRE